MEDFGSFSKEVIDINNRELIRLLEECMDLNPGMMREDKKLDDLEEWDSLARLSVISIVAERYNKVLSADRIKKVKTVSDLMKLIGE